MKEKGPIVRAQVVAAIVAAASEFVGRFGRHPKLIYLGPLEWRVFNDARNPGAPPRFLNLPVRQMMMEGVLVTNREQVTPRQIAMWN